MTSDSYATDGGGSPVLRRTTQTEDGRLAQHWVSVGVDAPPPLMEG